MKEERAGQHNQIITPDSDPQRFTAEEAALFRAGKCSWVTEYGNGLGDVHCGEPSEPGASFGNCHEHNAELLEDYYPDGTRRQACER